MDAFSCRSALGRMLSWNHGVGCWWWEDKTWFPGSPSRPNGLPLGRIGNPLYPWIILKTSHFVWSTGLPGWFVFFCKYSVIDPEDTHNHSESAKPWGMWILRKFSSFRWHPINHVGLPKKFLSYATLLNLFSQILDLVLLAAISKGGEGLAVRWVEMIQSHRWTHGSGKRKIITWKIWTWRKVNVYQVIQYVIFSSPSWRSPTTFERVT